jgi:hypothetical protein
MERCHERTESRAEQRWRTWRRRRLRLGLGGGMKASVRRMSEQEG